MKDSKHVCKQGIGVLCEGSGECENHPCNRVFETAEELHQHITEKHPSAAAGSEREAFAEKISELADVLDKLRPGTGPAIAMLLQDAYDEGWQAARAAAPLEDKATAILAAYHRGDYIDSSGGVSARFDNDVAAVLKGQSCDSVAAAPAPPSREYPSEFFKRLLEHSRELVETLYSADDSTGESLRDRAGDIAKLLNEIPADRTEGE